MLKKGLKIYDKNLLFKTIVRKCKMLTRTTNSYIRLLDHYMNYVENIYIEHNQTCSKYKQVLIASDIIDGKISYETHKLKINKYSL
mgnify:CR=1 FL=1